MLVIRLARTGRKKYPTYRVVAADSRRPTDGKFVSILGHYNPHTKDLSLKKEDIESYMAKGAQPSNSVIRLLEKEKVKMPEWVSYHSRNKASKQEAEAETAAPAAAAAPVDTEAPAESAETTSEEQPVAAEAVVATEEAEKVAGNAKNEEVVETAQSDQAEADKAAKVEEVAAEVAVDAAEESDQPKA